MDWLGGWVFEDQAEVYNIQLMKQLDNHRTSYLHILALPPGPPKLLMLQSLKFQLQSLQNLTKEESLHNEKNQITQTNNTNTSSASYISNSLFNQLPQNDRILPCSLTGNDLLRQWEERIVEKQRIKFGFNEEIQEYEEEYLGMQEGILAQQEKVYQLQKQIARKSFQISRSSAEKKEQEEQQENTGTSFAGQFMCFFLP